MAIEQKFFADPSAVLAAVAKIEQKMQSMDNAQKQASAKSKASSQEQIAQVKQWQSANDAALNAGIAKTERLQRLNQMLAEDQRRATFSTHRGVMASRAQDEAVALATQQKRLGLLDREIERYTKLGDAKSTAFGRIPNAPLGGLVGGMAGAVGALAGAAGERHGKWAEDVSKSSFTMSELELKLMNQADLSKGEAQERIRMVGGVIRATPSISTLGGGVEMQTWLESAGLNKKDVSSGKMLNVIAEGLTTLNAFGKDKGFTSDKESVRTIVGGAKAFGLGDDAAAVKKMSDVLSMGFKVSAMEAGHLPSFLKEGAAMSAFAVSPEQSMGIFSSLVSSGMPAESAATGMRAYATKLSDVRGGGESDEEFDERQNRRGRILQGLGLKKEDLQLTSKNSIFQSLDKFAKATEHLTEGDRQTAMTTVFGTEHIASIGMMMRDRKAMEGQAGLIGDNSALAATVSQSRRHQSFDRARTGIDTEVSDWESGIKIGTTWQDVEKGQADRYANRMSKAKGAGERFALGVEDVMLGIGNFFAKRIYTPEEIAPGLSAKRQEELMERQAIAAEKTAEAIINRGRNRNGNIENVEAN